MRTIFLLWLLTLTPATPVDYCADATEGTDAWFECLTGEKIDLTPVIQDEAQTIESQGRN